MKTLIARALALLHSHRDQSAPSAGLSSHPVPERRQHWTGEQATASKTLVSRVFGAITAGVLALGTLWMPGKAVAVGAWTAVSTQAPSSINICFLLSDGTVMAKGGGTSWYQLKPDSSGHYVNGTWSTLTSSYYDHLDGSSAVLQNGTVYFGGGENGNGTNYAEIFNPVSGSWTTSPILSIGISDGNGVLLNNGKVLIEPQGSVTPYGSTWLLDPATLTVTQTTGAPLHGIGESTWVKLPNDHILTIDSNDSSTGGTTAEQYNPATGTWSNAVTGGTVPNIWPDVSGTGYVSEMGPAFLLPNGNAIFFGGNGVTAVYNNGTWSQSATVPNGLGMKDAPGAMMANGKILLAVSPQGVNSSGSDINGIGPTSFYEYDYTANSGAGGYALAPSPGSGIASRAGGLLFLDLPDGTVLLSGVGSQLYVYQPDGSPVAGGQPTITTIAQNADGSYQLTGTQLNGISQGSSYGDDAQNDTNYPLVRLTSGGNVYYCRTYNWSSTSVATGSAAVTTQFTVPASVPVGSYSLFVVANGIASNPFAFTYALPPLNVTPAGGVTATGAEGGPFTPPSATYTLTNTGTAPFTWTASKTQPWIDLSSTGGTLAAGANTTVTATFNSAANSLAVGSYSDTLSFSDSTSGVFQTRPVALTVTIPLAITPATGLTATGVIGGPFTPPSATYTLTNNGSSSFTWTASKTQPWIDLSSSGGTLAAGANTTVTVSFNSAANSLAVGAYLDTVSFSDSTSGAVQTRAVSLTTLAPLAITPATGLTSIGRAGGPFTPASVIYTLTNNGGSQLNWTAANTQGWNTLSSAGGTLAAGANTTVTVSINTVANSLAIGSYADTLTFTNVTAGTSVTRPVALTVSHDYFTELISTGMDLANQSWLFTPNASGNYYLIRRTASVTSFPTNPTGGTALTLTDDSNVQVTPAGGAQVKLYGASYSSFYVGSNGYITFTGGDTTYTQTLAAHFNQPRISPLFVDLNPGTGGTVSWQQFTDRIVVTWQAVPNYGQSDSNNFQVEMFLDGRIRITCLGIGSAAGLIGLSQGLGTPADYTTSDMDTYPAAALSNVADLFSLTLSAGTLSPAFAAATTGYTATVSNATASLTLTPTAADSVETVKVNGTALASGSASAAVSLVPGSNTISVLVTAQDGVTTKTYAVVVTRLGLPVATTLAATSVTSTMATLNGNVNATSSSTAVSFDYGLTNAYGTNVAGTPATVTGSTNAAVTATLTGLTPLTTYHFRVNGTNVSGTANGTDLSFTTPTVAANWRLAFFGSTANTGNAADTADPYQKGIMNIEVFAFMGPNQDPSTATVAQLPQLQRIGSNLVYTFTQPTGVSGITYGAQWTSSLGSASWHGLTDTGTNGVHTFSLPISGSTPRFLRLTLTEQ